MAATFSFSADGTSSSLSIRQYVGPHSKFEFTVFFYGTFGGGTAQIEASPDGGTNWVDVPNGSATAETIVNMEIRATHLRVSLSGSSSPSLNVMIL